MCVVWYWYVMEGLVCVGRGQPGGGCIVVVIIPYFSTASDQGTVHERGHVAL